MENNNDSQQQQTLVYGKNAVTELLKSKTGADTVLIQDTLNEKVAGYFASLAKEAGAVVKTVHAAKLNAICPGAHQGVAAYATCINYLSLAELIEISKAKSDAPFYVLCDGIEDPHNLGAIIRSALLCGAHGVIIPKRGGVSVTPIVVKASAGAALSLPVARVANIGEAIRRLKEENVFVYCADMDGQSLSKTNLSGAVALVAGSEGTGVSRLVKSLCDGVVALDMTTENTNVDSYNVSVATGIILYEIMRTRRI